MWRLWQCKQSLHLLINAPRKDDLQSFDGLGRFKAENITESSNIFLRCIETREIILGIHHSISKGTFWKYSLLDLFSLAKTYYVDWINFSKIVLMQDNQPKKIGVLGNAHLHYWVYSTACEQWPLCFVKFPGTQDKYHMPQGLQTRAWSDKAKQYRDQLKLNRKFTCINNLR